MDIALVVDDSFTEQEILSGCLHQAGFTTVFTVASGEEALEKLSDGSCKPDIIILDVVLPGQSGFEICRVLKTGEGTKHIPIIICSVKATDMDKFWGKKQGADDYITKPLDQEEFIRTVKNQL